MKALFQRIAYVIVIFSFQVGLGQNNLTLDAKEVGTTTDFDFEIALDNTDAISALQFDINFNEDVLELATGHELSDRAANHTLAVSKPSEGVIRVILYSASNANVQGASGLLATLKIKTKTLPGNFSLSVSNIVASDANQNTVTVSGSSGSLKVLGPLLQISSSTINFGKVALGSTAQRSLSIQNNGTTDLTLTGSNAIQPFGVQQSFPLTIAANSSQNVTITLDTSNKYNNNVSLVFQNNDPDGLRRQTSVNLAAEVYAVNEIKVGSGNGEINTKIEIPVVIENMEPFNGFQFDIQLPTNVSYVANSLVTTNRKEDHNISASVVNGNILRFLAYSPTNTDFKDNAGEVLRFKVKPNIQSGTYPLYIQNAILTHATLGNILSDAYNGSISIDAPSLYINPSYINYNNVPITETRETTLRLTNYGRSQLNINELIFDNSELSLDISAPITIDAGRSKEVKLTFSPTTSGSFSETIAFRHNAANTQNLVTVTAQKFSPNYLTVVDATAKFGITNKIPIALENNDDLKAVQFDITLPNGFVMDVNALSTVNRAENFTAAASNVSGTTYRVIMYSASNTTIPIGSGTILQLPITLENSVNAGSYSFSFSNEILSDTNNKDVSSIALTQGQITVVEEGSVQVTLEPVAINSLGGQWRISGGDWQDSGTTLTELAVGNYTIEFKEVANWNKPDNKNISISKNQLTEVTGIYADPDSPTVVISSDASDPTNSSFTTTFTFTEDVTGFTIDDISATNATVSNFIATSASIYTALISPTSDGLVTINIAEGVAQDAANNGNNAADPFSLVYDAIKPDITISTTVSNPTNASFTTTFTFSEDVSGFTIDDIAVTNAGLSNFSSTSTSVYTVLVTPTSLGLVTLNIAEEVAQDAANNGNNAADQFSITYDNTKPTVQISSTASDPTNTSFTVTFTFSEDVTGFEQGDINLNNGTLSNFTSTSAKVYTVTITPTSDGTVTIDVNADVANDAAGNGNNVADQFSLTYDNTKPTLAISSTASDPTNSSFTATFTFSEDVTGFDQSDVSLTNATLSNFASSSARVFTATITPTSDGVITIDVNADVATDTAGNGNNAADQFSINYDNTKPTLAISSTASDPTNSSFTAIFTFSEDVSGFDQGDVTLTNATLSGFTSSSTKVYMATITPTNDGLVTIDVSGGLAVDAAGNGNTAASQFSISYDGTGPSVVISSTVSNPTQDPFTATITFSEDIGGFTIGDIQGSNATVSSFTSVTAKEYTVLVSPLAVGEVTLNISSDVAQDAAGNTNTAATAFTVNYVELGDLQVTLIPAVINTLGGQWRLSGGDWQDSGTTLSDLAAGSYTIEFKDVINWNTPSNKQVTIRNKELTQSTGVYEDPTKPTVVISSDANNPTNTIFTAIFIFSEDVTGFTIDDISVANAGLSNFSSTSSSVYSVLVTPTSHGLVMLNIAEGVAQDAANNGNNAADQFSITYDNTKPTLAISSTASDPTNSSFTATFAFSEDVSGFDQEDINLTNATVSGFTTSSTKVYTATITPTNNGVVTIDVNADVTSDTAGNGNNAADQFSINYDNTKPTLAISSTASDPTNAIFTATFTFSEDVTGFEQSDITLDNATLSNFTEVNFQEFTALITPLVEGKVTINIDEDLITDLAGNGNVAATQFTINYNNTLNTNSYEKVDFKIYPNPFNQQINISSDFKINKIELYSMNGKKILNIKHSKLIDVTNLAIGTYFIRIYFFRNVIVTKKIFKK